MKADSWLLARALGGCWNQFPRWATGEGRDMGRLEIKCRVSNINTMMLVEWDFQAEMWSRPVGTWLWVLEDERGKMYVFGGCRDRLDDVMGKDVIAWASSQHGGLQVVPSHFLQEMGSWRLQRQKLKRFLMTSCQKLQTFPFTINCKTLHFDRGFPPVLSAVYLTVSDSSRLQAEGVIAFLLGPLFESLSKMWDLGWKDTNRIKTERA